MKRKYALFMSLVAVAVAIIFGCQRSVNVPIGHPVVLVTASIQGRVIDENKMPVGDAIVFAGDETVNTDVNGNFTVYDVEMDKNIGYVKVQKEGYFTGSRTFVVNGGVTNKVQVELITKEISGIFNTSSGGDIHLTSGAKIQFPASGIINEQTKTAYNGAVNVSAFLLDPTAANFSTIMPGDLRGINSDNQETGLKSFGMLAVELSGSNGENLQLARGKTATLTFPIAATLQNEAPATIPLWYFDEVKGIWKEEGSASRQGNVYVGTVSHFSFWNVDAPYQLVDFTATFNDQNAKGVRDLYVVIKAQGDTSSITGSGYTDSTGKVSGKIPANQQLQMSVYNNCSVLLSTQNIGPFNKTADLGIVSLNIAAPVSVTISGTVLNCNNEAVTNGFVNVLLDGFNQRTSVTNGSFTLTIKRCSGNLSTAKVFGVDLNNNEQSPFQNITVTQGNAAPIEVRACGTSISEYVNFVLGGTSYSIVTPADSIASYRNTNELQVGAFTAWNNNSMKKIYFSFTGDSIPGTYPLNYLDISVDGRYYYQTTPINTTVTEYGPVNGFVTGSFTGNVTDSLNGNISVPLNCTYRVRRVR